MSLSTINQCTRDNDLVNRVRSAVAREAWANETQGATQMGQNVRQFGPDAYTPSFMWPVSIDYETEYAYAVDSGNPAPGLDPGVISDANISSAVQVHWPADPPATLP